MMQIEEDLRSGDVDLNVDLSGGQVGDLEFDGERELGQYTGCCSSYKNYYADDLCDLYGANCEAGGGSGDNNSGDGAFRANKIITQP